MKEGVVMTTTGHGPRFKEGYPDGKY